MPIARTSSPFRPLADLNTTPLIDVLLVLLVMLILAIPGATHSLAFPLPNGETTIAVNEKTNRVTLTAADTYLWNEAQVSEGELVAALRKSAAMKPEPQLQVAPDGGASYGASARLLKLVEASGVTNVGFVGNERYRNLAAVD